MTVSRKSPSNRAEARAAILREDAARLRHAQGVARDRFRQTMAGQTVLPFWTPTDDR